jgi:hypothetical protein
MVLTMATRVEPPSLDWVSTAIEFSPSINHWPTPMLSVAEPPSRVGTNR